MTTEFGVKAPDAPFPYTMKTTSIMEHSRGIAWTADLYRDKVGQAGIVEQMGDAGADRVSFHDAAHRIMWKGDVLAAFGGDEESATYYLLLQEDGE